MLAPKVVRVTLHDDTVVDCLIEQTGPLAWQATPVTHVGPHDVKSMYVDVIPPGASVHLVLEEVVVADDDNP